MFHHFVRAGNEEFQKEGLWHFDFGHHDEFGVQ
jgi:hypothetical protein